MAIPRQIFSPRKRRPSAMSFISPKLTELDLLHSLLHLTREISSLKPIQFLLKRNSYYIIRKTNLLSVLFEELIRSSIPLSFQSVTLCFEEMYIVLQRIKTLIKDCSNESKMAMLMQNESIADNFHKLTVDLSTLLDIFPVMELELSDDVRELVILIRKRCIESKPFVDLKDNELRHAVVMMLDHIKREIVPDQSKLADIFKRLEI
ncbi:hypothetical protein QN277_015767 [Acacia crassicarpa]|uniref:PUB 12/19-like N-terminal domain-containing protein n=1 Tax=Acacia crassicarpa TaxID=499986 RepID=A0AAE1JYD3_9FABA|nr:hypothetical protein QN277_015767 [Acacia crassicarpa]